LTATTTAKWAAALAVLLAVSAWAPGPAAAHDLVDQGRTAFEEAEFVDAIDAFARAEAADDLTVEDLAELYEVRALVHLAMGNEDAMQADLERLAVVAPQHELDRRVLPEVRRAFAEARADRGAPIRMLADPSGDDTAVTISVEVENDSADLVREVRIFGRGGEGDYRVASDAPLTITPEGAQIVEYYALAIGPGGAVLADTGSEADPLRYRVEGGAAAVEDDEDGGGSALPWVLVGLGVLAVGAAVVIAILLTGGSDSEGNTEVDPFVVRF